MRAKKFAMGLTALALMGMIVLPVSAQDTQQAEDTTIRANVASTYTLTIPAETEIAFEATSTDLAGALKVTGNVLPSQEVVVTAQAKEFHNTAQDKDLPYTLINKADTQVFTTDKWNEDDLRAGLDGDGQGKEIQLSIDITKENWDKAEAGDYEGTITFTADLQTK